MVIHFFSLECDLTSNFVITIYSSLFYIVFSKYINDGKSTKKKVFLSLLWENICYLYLYSERAVTFSDKRSQLPVMR